MRQIILDTETTGLEPEQGHRIIEIGGVELLNRRRTGNVYHQYLQPDREIDEGAIEVHGITNEYLADKPRFADIVGELMDFLTGAELVIHNASFDIGFINHELTLLAQDRRRIDQVCSVVDTLALARQLHPGQRNSLDALCKRYEIDNSQRQLHGALLDAEILADVYLAMTGGQASLSLDGQSENARIRQAPEIIPVASNRACLAVIQASDEELQAHEARLQALDKAAGGPCVWRSITDSSH